MSGPLGERFHALLVGIDAYLPNRLAEGTYPPLSGAVADVGQMHACLVTSLGIPEERIRRLTATRGADGTPTEPPAAWPTYERLVAALQALGRDAHPGDQVLFYYAGHGGRVPALLPDLKADGLDECLVPVDIGSSAARYLRDVELAHWIQAMVERELQVTLVLDCCHSGGATRDLAARGGRFVDRTPRPAASGVADAGELRQSWQALAGGGWRDVILGSGWLPAPRDFVLLAACQASEAAFEDSFDGVRQGVFTYWLVDSLRRMGPGVTYRRLHDRLVGKVHSQFETQTPVLEGDGARLVFGEDSRPSPAGIRVLEVDAAGPPDGPRVLLAAGRAHGLAPGSLLAIFPAGVEELGDVEARAALAEVTEEIDGATCRARLTESLRPGRALEAGALATWVDVGEIRLRRGVSLPADRLAPALRREVERGLAGSGFLEPRQEGADFRLAAKEGELAIEDPAEAPLLRLAAGTPAETIVARLLHLAKYRNIQELDNPDPTSRLAGGIELALDRLPGGWAAGRTRPVAAEELAPLAPSAVRHGDWLCLTVTNRAPRRFYFAVLDLQPGWAIEQVAPASGFTDTLPLEPGAASRMPLCARASGGPGRRPDILKVLASAETADFRWLELPRIGEPPRTTKGLPATALERLFDQLAGAAPATRSLKPRRNLGWAFWGAAQVEFQVEA